jgi:hypothetical protein
MRVYKELKILTTLVIITMMSVLSVYAVTYQYNITHVGTIQTIGVKVYADDNTRTELEELNWGDLFVGSTYYRYAFLKSTSTVNTTIQYTVNNLPSYLTFTLYYQTGYWSGSVWQNTSDWINMQANPYKIRPDEWLRIRFGLTVQATATPGTFSFTIIISAVA